MKDNNDDDEKIINEERTTRTGIPLPANKLLVLASGKGSGTYRICRDLARCLNCSGTQWCLTSVTKHSTCLALIQSKFSGGFSWDSVMFPYGGSNAIQCNPMRIPLFAALVGKNRQSIRVIRHSSAAQHNAHQIMICNHTMVYSLSSIAFR